MFTQKDVTFETHSETNENSSNKTILFKSTQMPSEDYDETDRWIVECCLRAHIRHSHATECDEGYNREDSVVITNTGKLSPLCTIPRRVYYPHLKTSFA